MVEAAKLHAVLCNLFRSPDLALWMGAQEGPALAHASPAPGPSHTDWRKLKNIIEQKRTNQMRRLLLITSLLLMLPTTTQAQMTQAEYDNWRHQRYMHQKRAELGQRGYQRWYQRYQQLEANPALATRRRCGPGYIC